MFPYKPWLTLSWFLSQVQRAELRLQGIQHMLSLLQRSHLIPSAHYALLCGWQGLLSPLGASQGPTPHCLADVTLIPPCDRILLQMAHSELSKWAIERLRGGLIDVEQCLNSKAGNRAARTSTSTAQVGRKYIHAHTYQRTASVNSKIACD